MRSHDQELLDNAIQALRSAEPEPGTISASAQRVAGRLGIAMKEESAMETIRNCDDVQKLFAAYRAGKLPEARALLIEAHLRECGDCLRQFRSEPGHAAVDWSAPQTGPAAGAKRAHALNRRPWAWGWAIACTAGVLAVALVLYQMYWRVPPGVRAEVRSIDGAAYLVSDSGASTLAPGARLSEGQRLRTAGGSRAVLRLADGSEVEVNERSELGVGARGRNMTVSLNAGAVIVQAAKRSSGHLYIRTPDCRVAVTGTVFSVDAGIKGSRVAVLEGTVDVEHSGIDTKVQAGDQLATSDNLSPAPLEEEIAWSQDRDKYLGLVAQFATLQKRIEQIPFPGPRYSSDLLDRVPAGTLLYVSIPNLGEFLGEANSIFHDQLSKSPELAQWWNRGHGNHTEELDALVEKLHEMSRYLGDEVVIVGVKGADQPGFAVLADLSRSGLDDFLKQQFPPSSPTGGLTVLDERALNAAAASPANKDGGYALLREREAVFSNSIATLREVNAQLNAGQSGFASGEFGKQIAAAYSRGAGIILSADIHQIVSAQPGRMHAAHGNEAMANSGLGDVQYLIAEHREVNGMPQNHLNLEFSGERQRVASWLAAPAPIESLDFVSPNAAFAVAGLTKDPKAIADDIAEMAAVKNPDREENEDASASEIESAVRNDLVANLGGDFLFSLDGPVLPTPSWKAIVEVRDSNRVEEALEHLTKMAAEQPHGKDFHEIAIEPSEAAGQRFYAVEDKTAGVTRAYYTFADGFMIVAPTRVLLIDALRAHTSGDSLARSAAFKALLPKDDSEYCSAVAYQNLSPVLSPLLSQVSGETASALRELAADSKPTAACAWGRESRIEAASDSRLFGFDFLTLGTLMHSGNNPATPNVMH